MGAPVPDFLASGWAQSAPVSLRTLQRAFRRELTPAQLAAWRRGEEGRRAATVYLTRAPPTATKCGAYAAHVAIAAARQELLVLPVADRDRITELIHARVELARTAALLPATDAHTLLPALTRAAQRVEAAADAIARHPAATPKGRPR
ncbi:hypothetical protein SAMN05444920_1378 [Nonomuraea solani]|uniref:Uncharacterized protein n=1 Tax=Nonomuraea solani TaxID=1144553 RepID=A0A1H6EZW5_9ACTN|nr:hypothetical protein [Nonomuraea solani]SEH03448.1 hypothetical protein SAMN05444920_1378 [Nonomuraea solani]